MAISGAATAAERWAAGTRAWCSLEGSSAFEVLIATRSEETGLIGCVVLSSEVGVSLASCLGEFGEEISGLRAVWVRPSGLQETSNMPKTCCQTSHYESQECPESMRSFLSRTAPGRVTIRQRSGARASLGTTGNIRGAVEEGLQSSRGFIGSHRGGVVKIGCQFWEGCGAAGAASEICDQVGSCFESSRSFGPQPGSRCGQVIKDNKSFVSGPGNELAIGQWWGFGPKQRLGFRRQPRLMGRTLL